MARRWRPLNAKLPFSLLPRPLVDRLPESWWALGNFHHIRFTAKGWSFDVMPREYDGVPVRTVQLLGQHRAWGTKPFDFEASQRHGETLEARRDREEAEYWAKRNSLG